MFPQSICPVPCFDDFGLLMVSQSLSPAMQCVRFDMGASIWILPQDLKSAIL